MQSKNYFKSVIKDRASERTKNSSIELAKREVLKHNKLYRYKKLTGDFEVVFD